MVGSRLHPVLLGPPEAVNLPQLATHLRHDAVDLGSEAGGVGLSSLHPNIAGTWGVERSVRHHLPQLLEEVLDEDERTGHVVAHLANHDESLAIRCHIVLALTVCVRPKLRRREQDA